MAAHLTDRKRKEVIADYIEIGSYNAVAKKHGVSLNTVKNVVQKNADVAEKCRQKKEENSADILAHMEARKGQVCLIIDKYLAALMNDRKIAMATTSQLTTALGTLIDKFTSISNGAGEEAEEDELSRSLRELGEGLKSD